MPSITLQDAIERAIGRAQALREKITTNAKKVINAGSSSGVGRGSASSSATARRTSHSTSKSKTGATATATTTGIRRHGNNGVSKPLLPPSAGTAMSRPRISGGGSSRPATTRVAASGGGSGGGTTTAGRAASGAASAVESRPKLADIKPRLPMALRKTAGKLSSSVQHLHAAASLRSPEAVAFLKYFDRDPDASVAAGGTTLVADQHVPHASGGGGGGGAGGGGAIVMTAERITAGYRRLNQCMSNVSAAEWRLLESPPTPGTLMQQYRLSCLTRTVIEESARLDAASDTITMSHYYESSLPPDTIFAAAAAATAPMGFSDSGSSGGGGGDGRSGRASGGGDGGGGGRGGARKGAHAVVADHTARVRASLEVVDEAERVRATFTEGAPEQWLSKAVGADGTTMSPPAVAAAATAALSASEQCRRSIACPSATIGYTDVKELLRIDTLKHEAQVLAVQIETELLLQGALDTMEAMPVAETPDAEKAMAAIYRTVLRLRSNHDKEPTFVLAT